MGGTLERWGGGPFQPVISHLYFCHPPTPPPALRSLCPPKQSGCVFGEPPTNRPPRLGCTSPSSIASLVRLSVRFACSPMTSPPPYLLPPHPGWGSTPHGGALGGHRVSRLCPGPPPGPRRCLLGGDRADAGNTRGGTRHPPRTPGSPPWDGVGGVQWGSGWGGVIHPLPIHLCTR